jgi:hypothetical protein
VRAASWRVHTLFVRRVSLEVLPTLTSAVLLALAVQAENTFSPRSISKSEEIRALLTNVKVILAGLEAYGTMWDGIGIMAAEVRAALEAASTLPDDVVAAERLQQ